MFMSSTQPMFPKDLYIWPFDLPRPYTTTYIHKKVYYI